MTVTNGALEKTVMSRVAPSDLTVVVGRCIRARLPQPLTAPIVKPEMKRSRKALNSRAIGTATRMTAA